MGELSTTDAIAITQNIMNQYRAAEKLRDVLSQVLKSEQRIAENQRVLSELQMRATKAQAETAQAEAALAEIDLKRQRVADEAHAEQTTLQRTLTLAKDDHAKTVAEMKAAEEATRAQLRQETRAITESLQAQVTKLTEEHAALVKDLAALRRKHGLVETS